MFISAWHDFPIIAYKQAAGFYPPSENQLWGIPLVSRFSRRFCAPGFVHHSVCSFGKSNTFRFFSPIFQGGHFSRLFSPQTHSEMNTFLFDLYSVLDLSHPELNVRHQLYSSPVKLDGWKHQYITQTQLSGPKYIRWNVSFWRLTI